VFCKLLLGRITRSGLSSSFSRASAFFISPRVSPGVSPVSSLSPRVRREIIRAFISFHPLASVTRAKSRSTRSTRYPDGLDKLSGLVSRLRCAKLCIAIELPSPLIDDEQRQWWWAGGWFTSRERESRHRRSCNKLNSAFGNARAVCTSACESWLARRQTA
jgi:hypothetical protein